MHEATLTARIYLLTVCFLGLLTTLAVMFLPATGDSLPWPGVGIMLLLAMITGSKKVQLISSRRDEEAGCLSLGVVVTLAAMLLFGTRAGVLAGIVSGLSASLYPNRMPWKQLAFNTAAIALTAAAAGMVYHVVYHPPVSTGAKTQTDIAIILPLLLATLTYFLVNTGLIGTVIALFSRQNVWKFWKKNYPWTAPSYFFSAACAALAKASGSPEGIRQGQGILTGALLLVPVLVFIYYYYRTYTDKVTAQAQHIEDLNDKGAALNDLYISTVKSLAAAIDARDQMTHAHILRVQNIAVAIARQVGMDEVNVEAVGTGALLHDIGKLGVPDYILLKPGTLNEEEFDKMKRHTVIGASILEPVSFPGPVIEIVRNHHERWDGTGYPDGLKGEDIPLAARIMTVADVYDALTSDRPYRPRWTRSDALAYLRSRVGIQFDPAVVQAFEAVVDIADTLPLNTMAIPAIAGTAQDASQHIRRTGTELWALYEVSQAIHSRESIEARLRRLQEIIVKVLPGSSCVFLLQNGCATALQDSRETEVTTGFVNETLIWAADRSLQQMNSADPHRGSPSLEVACTRHPYRGVYKEDVLTQAIRKPEEAPFQSALIVPLVHLGETLGTINLYHTVADAFTADDETLLAQIAEQVQSDLARAILIDRARGDALTDPLTGLHNVRFLEQAIRPLTAPPEKEKFALLYLDLDNFKTVNDTFGHEQGNMVLKDVARLFRAAVRPGDHVIRYGGDEFVIILPDTTRFTAEGVSGRIRRAIQEYVPHLNGDGPVTIKMDISIGLATFPEDGRGLSELVASADRQMYAEKFLHKEPGQAVVTVTDATSFPMKAAS